MKIRRFNESTSKEIDMEYIRHCFADLIDSGKAMVEEKSSAAYGSWAEVNLLLKFPQEPRIDPNMKFKSGASWVTNTSKIGDSAKTLEEAAAQMREIETAIERLADEYPDYSFKIGSGYFGPMGAPKSNMKVIIFP